MTIVVILLLGLTLRLVNLNQSLWLDEAVQVITSQGSFLNIFSELKGDFHPPLYHFLMWGWLRVFGSSEISMRIPSVLFGVGTIYLIYLIAKNLFPTRGVGRFTPLRCSRFTPLVGEAKMTALFLAIAPFHIYYSQEARMYSMVTFFASLSMYWFIRGFKKGVFSYVVSTILMLYTDYYGFLILLAQNCIVLIRYKRGSWKRSDLREWLKIQLRVIFLFLPWLPMFLTQLKTGSQAMAVLPGWGKLVNIGFLKALPLTFVKFAIGRITIFNKKIYAVVAGALFLVYGGIVGKGVLLRKRLSHDSPRRSHGFSFGKLRIQPDTFEVSGRFLLITLWLLVPIIFAWLISLFIPNYQPFRLLLVLPAFYLLLALGISQAKSSMYRYIELFLVVGISLVSLGVYYFNPYFYREDWRGLVGFVESQESAIALLPSETSGWPWQYYSEDSVDLLVVSSGIKPVVSEDFNNLKIAPTESRNKLKIYYIRYLVPLFDPEEKIDFWLKERRFVKIKEIDFNQIPVWEYERQE